MAFAVDKKSPGGDRKRFPGGFFFQNLFLDDFAKNPIIPPSRKERGEFTS
jgi:hypothetical protein